MCILVVFNDFVLYQTALNIIFKVHSWYASVTYKRTYVYWTVHHLDS